MKMVNQSGVIQEKFEKGSVNCVETREKLSWLRAGCGRRGAWMAQVVEHLTSAQVMISGFVSSSPASLLSVQNLVQILCPPLSLSLPLPCSVHTQRAGWGKKPIVLAITRLVVSFEKMEERVPNKQLRYVKEVRE